MSKIVSMSVWGNDKRYSVGAINQISLIKEFFPNWEIRLYTDNILPFIDQKDIVLIPMSGKTPGYFWRFLPIFEHEENIVLVRDSDSRFTFREVRAVNEWLESDKKLHTFKDHEAHYEFPIMAGTFGFKGIVDLETKNKMIEYENNQYYTSDQVFLANHIWNKFSEYSMVHSMDSGWFAETRNLLVNPYSFCGNGYDENDMPIYPPKLGGSLLKAEVFDKGVMHELHDVFN
jgi:hypothetical protein